ncbi:MAG: hypothetical protein ACE148_01975 [Vicinamibacterales bacterium]
MTTSRGNHALFESLVADATMAASSHNTQPWRFEIGEDRIRILPEVKSFSSCKNLKTLVSSASGYATVSSFVIGVISARS